MSPLRDLAQIVLLSLTKNARRTTILAAPLIAVNLTLLGVLAAGSIGVRATQQRFEDRGAGLFTVERASTAMRGTPAAFGPSAVGVLAPIVGRESTGSATSYELAGVARSTADSLISETEFRTSLLMADDTFLSAVAADYEWGGGLRRADVDNSAHVVVLGWEIATEYDLTTVSSRKRYVQVAGKLLRVVGVVRPNSRFPSMNAAIVVPRSLAPPPVDSASSGQTPREIAVGRAPVGEVRSAVAAVDLALDAQSETPLRVDFDNSLVRSYSDSIASLRLSLLIAGAIGTLTSLVAGLYLQSSSFKLRRVEIGTRRALGTTSRTLRHMLIAEGAAVGCSSWIIAVGAGLAFYRQVSVEPSALVLVLSGLLVFTVVAATTVPLLVSRRLLGMSPAELLAADS